MKLRLLNRYKAANRNNRREAPSLTILLPEPIVSHLQQVTPFSALQSTKFYAEHHAHLQLQLPAMAPAHYNKNLQWPPNLQSTDTRENSDLAADNLDGGAARRDGARSGNRSRAESGGAGEKF